MKKLFYLLLLVYSGIFAQVSSGMEQEFDYGIKNNSSQQILTPDTLVTKGVDGTYGHTSAYRLPVSNDTYDALQTKVPYTGATSNVNLGENGLTTGYLGLDLTPTNTPTAVGTFYWDTINKTASLIDGSGNTVLQIGQEERILIHNGTGSALTDGQVVYVTGSTGLLPSVALANASSEVTSSKTIGVVTESIANGASGFITTTGLINGLNTSAYNEGDILWLGTTAGTYTTTAPTSPNHRVLIGYVIKKAGGNGSILVKIQNTQELSESSDVLLGTLSNNDILIYESSTGLWKNKTAAEVGLAPATGGTGYIQNQDTSAQSANMWISGSVKNNSGIYFSPSNTSRALVRAEVVSGDLRIFQYDSGGAYLRNALSISNSTGAATFASTVTASNVTANGDILSNALNSTLNFSNGSGTSYASLGFNNATNYLELKQKYTDGGIQFFTNTSSERMRITSGGNVLIGTTTDNGVDKLQVNGTVSSGNTTLGTSQPTANNQLTRKDYVDTAIALKANLASPTFTGTPIAPTAAAGTNTTQVATTAFVQSALRPYKVYTALLTQTGTNAPVATVLENTLGGTVTWSRTVPGGYFATLSNAFTTDKTTVLITNGSTNGNYIHGAAVSTTNVNIIAPNDGQIDRATIEIRVYN